MKSSVVYGKGVNDLVGGITPIRKEYDQWKNMLARCYSGFHSTYADVHVCDEWLLFSNFLGWLRHQDWEGKHLDKDIIIIGNRLYSPDRCVYVHPSINHLLKVNSEIRLKELPLGVRYSNNGKRFVSNGRDDQWKVISLGTVDTPEEAHLRWQLNKVKRLGSIRCLSSDERVLRRIDYEIERISSDAANGRLSEWY